MSADNLSLKPLEQQFEELRSIINYHRSRASYAVNEQQLLTAWNVGAYVSNKLKTNEWGSKVVTQFVEYMKVNAPAIKGYSRASIYNMVMFFDEYSSDMFLSIVSKFYPNDPWDMKKYTGQELLRLHFPLAFRPSAREIYLVGVYIDT